MGSPRAARPGALSETGLEKKDFTTAWLGVEAALAPGLALPGSSLARFSAPHASPLPGKFSQQNYAPSLSFRHSRSDLEANVNQTGKHGKERARRPPELPQQARKLVSPTATPEPLACAFFNREVCLRGVQASLQRNNTEMPFMIRATYGNRMCTLGVFICSSAQVPKQAALLSSPSYSSSRGINLTETIFYFSRFPTNR